MREDDNNIILRKHREVQRYSFQNISTQVNKFQVSTQTIYSNQCCHSDFSHFTKSVTKFHYFAAHFTTWQVFVRY
jgi:hypothetical protein